MTTDDPHAGTPRAAQTQATMDLFAAFARSVTSTPDDLNRHNDAEPVAIRQALWCLVSLDYPLTGAVLNAIHAERRRRMSAATRDNRKKEA